MLKVLYFSGGYQVFQMSLGIKSLYDRGKKLIHLLPREGYLGTEEEISENLSTRQTIKAHLIRALGQGVFETLYFLMQNVVLGIFI